MSLIKAVWVSFNDQGEPVETAYASIRKIKPLQHLAES